MEDKSIFYGILIAFVAFIIIAVFALTNRSNSVDLKKLESCQNELQMALKNKNKAFNECKTQFEFARLLTEGMDVSGVENMQLPGIKSISYTEYEVQNYNLTDFLWKPTIHSNSRTAYYILNFTPLCKAVNAGDISSSGCVIAADINGIRNPNEEGKDRFYFIFDGPNYKFILVKNSNE